MTHVSPMVRARAIVAGDICPEAECQRYHAARMVRLSLTVIADLESEEAPFHIFRWVAWGATLTEQRRRTDLVIHIRRSIERPKNGWVEERHCAAAMDAWDHARSNARKRGGIMPAVHEIALEVYRAAIEGAKRPPRTRGPTAEAVPATTELEAAEGGAAEPAEREPDDSGEEEPVSRPHAQGRDHVLRLLSDAVRAALAAQDVEAADAANDAISRLCGRGEIG